VALVLVPGAAAGVTTDRVLISGGDQLTGEIKQMKRGNLKFKTKATDAIDIEADLVMRLTSPRQFEVEVRQGDRYYGILEDSESDRMLLVVNGDETHTISLDEIVRIYPIEGSFLKKLDGSVALGFNTTKSTGLSQLNLNCDVKYSSERYYVRASFDSTTTDQDSGTTSRNYLTLSSSRRLGRKWLTLGLASLQSNEDLGIANRILLGGGFGRYMIETAHNELAIAAGVAINRENYEESEPSDTQWEGILMAQYWIYRNLPHDVELSVSVDLFPGISDSSRLRSEVSIDYQHEIVNNLTLGLNLYSSTDNKPSPGSDDSDYGITTSVGWKF
jgi:putative salt-induced outer membrane protein YdiY